jgi:YidC/Oxa1 family membrane protein insertase
MFNTLLTQPIFNTLIFLYNNIGDFGVSIILLTIIIRTILAPLFYKSFKNQTLLQKLQPEIQKIQHDHKDDREEQARRMLELYKQHKVNPFSGFLLILVQLPVLIAVYRVFYLGVTSETLKNLYPFVSQPEVVNSTFLGLIDLSNKSILIVVLAAVFQYVHGRLTLPKIKKGEPETQAVKISRKMIWIGPILAVVILFNMPSAVGVYWLTTTLFSLAQQLYINKKIYGEDQSNNTTDPGISGV